MDSDSTRDMQNQLHELIGAVDILNLLREEIEQWLEEAQNESKREALENVLGHLGVVEEEYKQRRDELSTHLQ